MTEEATEEEVKEAMKSAVDKANERSEGDSFEPSGDDWMDARAQRSQAYYRTEVGKWVLGILCGRFAKPGNRKGHIYQIRATVPQLAQVVVSERGAEKAEYEEQEVPVGTIISVDEKSALEGLRELSEDDKDWEIFIRADEKRKIVGTERSFWDMTVRKRIVALPFAKSDG